MSAAGDLLLFLARREATSAPNAERAPLRLTHGQHTHALELAHEILGGHPVKIGSRLRGLADLVEATQTDPGQVDLLVQENDRRAEAARRRALREAIGDLDAPDLWDRITAHVGLDHTHDREAAA